MTSASGPSTGVPPDSGFSGALSGSLLLAGAYALLVPGGRGVAVAWPPEVCVTATPAAAWSLDVRDDRGRRGESAEALAAAVGTGRALALELDFGALPAGGTSALACLAVARAEGLAGEAALARAHEVHRRLQGGRGSGYDVAVSHARAPLALETGPDGRVRARGVAVAAGHAFVVALGPKRARTAEWIARFEAARRDRSGDVERLVLETSAVATDLGRALALPGGAPLPDALRRLGELRPLANALLGDPYGTPLDEALLAAASRLGVSAHPSGAAGDTWLAAHPDPERLGAVTQAWSALGARVFGASCDAPRVLGLSAVGAGR